MRILNNLTLLICFVFYNTLVSAQDILYDAGVNDLGVTILLNVDPATQSSLQDTLDKFAGYLNEEGYTVLLHIVEETHPEELREYLQDVYQSQSPQLQGAIFIGDFPMAFSLVHYPQSDVTLPAMSMEFYQDLDGSYELFEETPDQVIYHNHDGEVKSEIWTSVLPLVGWSGTDEPLNYVKNYFRRNFEFRDKQFKELKRGLAKPVIGYKNTDQWQEQVDAFTQDPNHNLLAGNLTITKDNIQSDNPAFPDAYYTFTEEMQTNNFDFTEIGGHGTYLQFSHTDPSIVVSRYWAMDNPIKPLYVISGSCSAGEYFVSEQGSVSTAFLYNPEGNVLIFHSATENSYGGYPMADGPWGDVTQQNLAAGMSWGEALLYNFNQEPGNLGGREREVYSATRILFGDGTLKLQEHMDYRGNDFPYILAQNSFVTEPDQPFSINLDDLTVKDDDSTLDELTLHYLPGEHYTIENNEIVPEPGYTGFLNIPMFLNDGIEDGQIFNFIVKVEVPETNYFQLVDLLQVLEEEIEDFTSQLKQDLPGRFYHIRTQPIIFFSNNQQLFDLNLFARGTDMGEVNYSKTFIVGEDPTNVDQLDTFQDIVVWPNPNHGYVQTNLDGQTNADIFIFDAVGHLVEECSACTGLNHQLSPGNYYLQIGAEGKVSRIFPLVVIEP